jgi:UDP-glucuronate 4-epimerase
MPFDVFLQLRKSNLQMNKILVTGAAGFIGYHLSKALLEKGEQVIGIDNLNDYYDVQLKKDRLAQLEPYENFSFQKLNLEDRSSIESLFKTEKPSRVVNLAAQAGVRYSLKNPHAYVDSNIVGFVNLLEGCRNHDVEHFVFASSSSVYGANTKMPFSVHHNVDHPVSLYAATKKANELMAHSYAHLYELSCTGLRFFTVYGPWGRPDMAYFLFTKAIYENRPINVFNNGEMQRDFTYIDDVIEAVVRLLDKPAKPNSQWSSEEPDSASSYAPYQIYNIGNNQPTSLMKFIQVIEDKIGKEAIKRFLPMQPGDVPATFADIFDLANDVGFKPDTDIESGIGYFMDWYRDYFKL